MNIKSQLELFSSSITVRKIPSIKITTTPIVYDLSQLDVMNANRKLATSK